MPQLQGKRPSPEEQQAMIAKLARGYLDWRMRQPPFSEPDFSSGGPIGAGSIKIPFEGADTTARVLWRMLVQNAADFGGGRASPEGAQRLATGATELKPFTARRPPQAVTGGRTAHGTENPRVKKAVSGPVHPEDVGEVYNAPQIRGRPPSGDDEEFQILRGLMRGLEMRH